MYIKIPPHLACIATLHYETLTSAKQAINDKLQGSVTAHLRCGEVFNNQIKTVYCWAWEWKKLKSVNIWQSYDQNVIVSRTFLNKDCFFSFAAATTFILQRPDLQNFLLQSYDYLTIMPNLRSTYDGRLIYQTSYEKRSAKSYVRFTCKIVRSSEIGIS